MERKRTDIIVLTQALWGKRSGKDISDKDAKEIVDNVTVYFKILTEWEHDSSPQGRKDLREDTWITGK